MSSSSPSKARVFLDVGHYVHAGPAFTIILRHCSIIAELAACRQRDISTRNKFLSSIITNYSSEPSQGLVVGYVILPGVLSDPSSFARIARNVKLHQI
jgi:hypothetical protein